MVATVKDLIEYLQKNCKPDDKLCFFNEPGAYITLEHLPKDFIGDRFYIYVKDFKEKTKNLGSDDELFKYVDDNDIIIY